MSADQVLYLTLTGGLRIIAQVDRTLFHQKTALDIVDNMLIQAWANVFYHNYFSIMIDIFAYILTPQGWYRHT